MIFDHLASNFAFFGDSNALLESSINNKNRILGKSSALSSLIQSYTSNVNPHPLCFKRKLPNRELFSSNTVNNLFVGDPSLSELARHRSHGEPRSLSLIGLTHSLSTPSAINSLLSFKTPHLYEWDALICTSAAAKSAVMNIFNHISDLDPSHSFNIRLPVIPLGVNVSDYRRTFPKSDSRSSLNIPADSFVCLWIGRLEQHCKSHHAASFRVLQRLALSYPERNFVYLIFGTSLSPQLLSAIKDSAFQIAPNVDIRFIDGFDKHLTSTLISASDIFLSLVDSLQETFGLTPVEAMAAGLPVVASDWNGYRDTLIDGITGFLVPTTLYSPTLNSSHVDYLSCQESSVDTIAHLASTSVAIDEQYAYIHISRLIECPSYLHRLSENCLRISEDFDWVKVFSRYESLLMDLSQSRRNTAVPNVSSDFPSYFKIFSSWPSFTYDSNSVLAVSQSLTIDNLRDFISLPLKHYHSLLPPFDFILDLYSIMSKTPSFSPSSIYKLFSPAPDLRVFNLSVSFLLKHQYLVVVHE